VNIAANQVVPDAGKRSAASGSNGQLPRFADPGNFSAVKEDFDAGGDQNGSFGSALTRIPCRQWTPQLTSYAGYTMAGAVLGTWRLWFGRHANLCKRGKGAPSGLLARVV
jgi:hypothetical protein